MVLAKGKTKTGEDLLTETLEKYLLSIHKIVSENGACRVKDVAGALNIGGPTTSSAIKTLAAKGFINYAPYGVITLTPKGVKKTQEKLYRRSLISNFLEKVLLVSGNNIEEGVKSIEYSISKDILERFSSFLIFMENCPCKETKWLKSFKQFLKDGNKMSQKCNACAVNGRLKQKTFYCSGCDWLEDRG